jgi:DNA topoisomerase-1
MEERLDEVEEGKADWLATLGGFYKPFAADLEEAEKNMQRPEPEATEHKCEQCGKPMLKRWSRRGAFLGCSGYPACRFTQSLDPEGKPAERVAPEPTDEKCDKCGASMVIRTGRHGRFMACSAFPKCKNTRSLASDPRSGERADPQQEIPDDLKTCEQCGKPMILRHSRRGPFLGCSSYPKCRNTKPLPKPKKGAADKT